jgi:hypothetical protein
MKYVIVSEQSENPAIKRIAEEFTSTLKSPNIFQTFCAIAGRLYQLITTSREVQLRLSGHLSREGIHVFCQMLDEAMDADKEESILVIVGNARLYVVRTRKTNETTFHISRMSGADH